MARKADSVTETEQQEEVTGWLAGLGAEATKVKIYRLDMGRHVWMDTLPPMAVSEENIREKYGRGDYVIRVVDSGGRFVKGGNKLISIGGEPLPPAVVERETPQQNGIGTDRILELMLLMIKQSSDQTIAMIQAMGNRQTPQFDPASAMAAMVSAVTALKSSTEAPSNFAQLKETLELVDSFRGEGNGKPENEILAAAKVIGPFLSGGGNPPPARPAQIAAGPPPDNKPDRIQISVWGRLMFKAMRDGDPELMCDWLREAYDEPTPEGEETRQIVQAILQAKDFQAWASGIGSPDVPNSQVPSEGRVREWLEVFFNAVRIESNEPEETETK